LAFVDGVAQPPAKGNNTNMDREEIDDDDLKDTGTSPIKTNKMEVDLLGVVIRERKETLH
jgi:hypothetical protein